MLTVSQRRSRTAKIRAGCCILLAALILTPQLNGFDFETLPFPLITTASAASPEQ
jgi:hypothetical protein